MVGTLVAAAPPMIFMLALTWGGEADANFDAARLVLAFVVPLLLSGLIVLVSGLLVGLPIPGNDFSLYDHGLRPTGHPSRCLRLAC